MLEVVFGEQTVGGTQVSDWFSKWKSTEPYLKECEHSGYQVVNKTAENVDQVKKLVFESRRIAVEMSKCWEFHWIV
jgi:Zn/Cd-binding protein ZinT